MAKEKRRRSESVSPERIRKKKSRSRSKERKKERKEKKRSRSRSKEKKRSRERKEKRRRSKSRETKSRGRDSRGNSQEDDKDESSQRLDKDKEQARLELEMARRRERIEKWRAEKKKKEVEVISSSITKEEEETVNGETVVKKWSLEEDGDDEAEEEEDQEEEVAAVEDDEIDPLDAYMTEVSKEVRKIKGGVNLKNSKIIKNKNTENNKTVENGDSAAPAKKKAMVIMTGVAKKKPDVSIKKPEVMEQNQDGLEYSSEDEKVGLDDLNGKLKEKSKKELVKIDHAGIEYEPFRKDFYLEVPEIAKMSDAEVEEYRTELEGVKTKGKNVPRPIKNWPQCGVSAKILHLLKKNGYEKPTPIQAQAIPVCMSGRDIIGIAKTGSGKTLAFLLPLFRHIADQDELEEGDGPIAIILTPTRELCLQIGKECRKFVKAIGARAVCVYGGTGISEQIAELKRGAEIIVCTPGRMIDMLAANSGKVTNLRRITYIVLDEADRMFDMGFEPQG